MDPTAEEDVMSDCTRVVRRACPRQAAVVIAATVLALLAVACGGSNPPRAVGQALPNDSASASAVAYSACMRSHGVPQYPDPNSNGDLPKGNAQAFGVSNSQYQAAEGACRHLLPNSDMTFTLSLNQCLMSGDCPPAVVQRALEEGLRFARCMRSHGVPNWPDPTIDSTGRPSFQTTGAGISIAATRSPQMLSEIGHCQNQPGALLLRQE
jgi:hypothetical protein